MTTDIIMTTIIFGSPILLAFIYLRFRLKKFELLERLINNQSELSMDLIKLIQKPHSNNALNERKLGVFFCSLSIATIVILALQVFNGSPRLALLGLLPLCIGISFFIMAKLSDNSRI